MDVSILSTFNREASMAVMGSTLRNALRAPRREPVIMPTAPRAQRLATGVCIDEGEVLWQPHFGHSISVSRQVRHCSDGKERIFTSATCSCGATWSNDGGECAVNLGSQELRQLAIYGEWLD